MKNSNEINLNRFFQLIYFCDIQIDHNFMLFEGFGSRSLTAGTGRSAGNKSFVLFGQLFDIS